MNAAASPAVQATNPSMKALSLLRCFSLPAAAAAALFLSACSTPQSRIEANPGIVARLSAEDRALASAGRVREGMTRDAVFIAWGRPDRVYKGTRNGKSLEAWIYTTRELRYAGGFDAFPYPIYRSRIYYSRRAGRYFIADFGPDPFFYRPTYSVEVPFRRVQFENGRVNALAERQ